MLASWGRQRRLVDTFHTHLLESAHWLGSKHLAVASYGMPVTLPDLPPGVTLPRRRVHGLAFTREEADFGKAFGWIRTVAHLGKGVRWYPFPPWIDRDREEAVTMEKLEGSFRMKNLDPKKIRGVSVRWKGRFLILEIPEGRAEEVKSLVAGLEERKVLSFDSCLHPESDFCATWKAGQARALHGYGSGGR
jgi:hypothetical protein